MTESESLQAERAELDTLIESGIEFTVPDSLPPWTRPPWRRGKARKFTLRQPYLGTLDYLSREYIEMGFSEKQLQADPFGESKRLMAENALRCARVVAIAVLNCHWKIKLLTPFLAWFFRWHLTPESLFRLTVKINEISNLGDFTNSIRFLSVSRTTMPTPLIEKNKPG